MWSRIVALSAGPFLLASCLILHAQTPQSADPPSAAQSAAHDVDVDPPMLVHAPNPKYPKNAREAGHQGTSILSLVVGTDGHPHDIAVVRPLDAELDQYAIEAVTKWRYRPASKDGEPVEVEVHTRVRFRLYDKSFGHIAELWDRSDANDPKADLQLSKAYYEGNGVPQDEDLGFAFLKMAADWNLPQAQYLMADHFYREGDNVHAYMWYALSKRAGGADGEKMLKVLAAEMSPEQISEAELRVNYWPEDPPKAD
jgi:TonB family protein